MKKETVVVRDSSISLDRVTKEMMDEALAASFSLVHAECEKMGPAGGAQLAAAAMSAAAAGPLAILGSFLSKRNQVTNETREENSDVNIVSGIDPDSMLVAALLVRHVLKMVGDMEGRLEFDMRFDLSKLADAMRDYHKLTGHDAANFIRADFVELAALAETEKALGNIRHERDEPAFSRTSVPTTRTKQ